MARRQIAVTGVLRKGCGVASGPSSAYPYGSLERQVPLFKRRGLDLGDFHLGTLNVDIGPFVLDLLNPEFTFRDVHWTDLHPPETFSFSRCELAFADRLYDGWIYYPHPETKQRHHHDPSLVEVITRHVPGLHHGGKLELRVQPERIAVRLLNSPSDHD